MKNNWCTLFLNPNLSVWTWVPEQTLKSNPRESTQISCASCNNCNQFIIDCNIANVLMLVHMCSKDNGAVDNKGNELLKWYLINGLNMFLVPPNIPYFFVFSPCKNIFFCFEFLQIYYFLLLVLGFLF